MTTGVATAHNIQLGRRSEVLTLFVRDEKSEGILMLNTEYFQNSRFVPLIVSFQMEAVQGILDILLVSNGSRLQN